MQVCKIKSDALIDSIKPFLKEGAQIEDIVSNIMTAESKVCSMHAVRCGCGCGYVRCDARCGAVRCSARCGADADAVRCGAAARAHTHTHTNVHAQAQAQAQAHAVTLTPPCIQIYTAYRERTARKNQWKKVFPPLEVARRDLGVRKSGTMAYAYDVPLEKVYLTPRMHTHTHGFVSSL